MEFGQKLQQLRRERGITQEELAQKLYVSRTAISKWESGRGYPNIDSIKAISRFFSVSIDELLSSGEAIAIAEEDNKKKEKQFFDLFFGVMDVCMAMLFFLPFFATREEGVITEASLLSLSGIDIWLKAAYIVAVSIVALQGVVTLALQNCEDRRWIRVKRALSVCLGGVAAVLFVLGLQPYAAIFALALTAAKALMLIKRR